MGKNTNVGLGELTSVDVRKAWPNEASDFTPWLAEENSIDLLGQALGMELAVEATEVSVGPYSADILAKDVGSGRYVVIENQLEKTDHDHIGKAITYAAALDASSIVWIAPEFTEEHKRALNWLNDNTSTDIAFFGVQLELWKIDDSRPSVRFDVVSRPVELVRQAGEAAKGLSETQELQFRFWSAFRESLKERSEIPSVQNARAQYWYDVAVGKSGIVISNIANTRVGKIGVRLYISHTVEGDPLAALEAQKADIEAEIDCSLEWNPHPENRDKIIAVDRDGDIGDEESWPDLIEWMVGMVVKFRLAFAPRVKML